ncbi:dephospho-CoA kinase [Candidatus Epulonipiscium fishelsonii]|uniref:Dephospho-CoA kinase n=1 Tax=Candidatus Epulonipiscium fishelsonii TaxID=77094 RepID=A0ACC8XEB9_9FIRM|nr:dephospho-CoA kinase [Epulopiscium sp. SCG-D08WGA-EpuloA1]
MMVIGVVGGIGSGKSTVVDIFSNLRKIYIINADKIGHNILKRNGLAYKKILETFGIEILDEDKEIVRSKLAKIVFSDKIQLNKLNSISHPLIYKIVFQEIEKYKFDYDYIIIEAALPIEIGLMKLVDKMLVIYADEDIRIQRIIERNNCTYSEAKARVVAQKKWEQFKDISDYIIYNTNNLGDTENQLKAFIKKVENK